MTVAYSNKLFVFPGVGSPENDVYSDVYLLIEEGAVRFGFNDVKVCHWPGQAGNGSDELTLGSAVEVAKKTIKEIENSGGTYAILGRSFGTLVCVKTLSEITVSKLSRIMLWGPPPFYVLWDLFYRDFEKNKETARQKGTRIGRAFFESIIPLESLIPHITCKTLIANGTEDIYCKHFFLDYLKNLDANPVYISLGEVKGAPHEVTRKKCPANVVEEYQQVLFNEDFIEL